MSKFEISVINLKRDCLTDIGPKIGLILYYISNI